MRSCLDNLPEFHEGFLSLTLRRWRLQNRFFRRFGKYVNFDAPATMQEKTQYRKIYGNQTLLAFLSDKYRVREYVQERVGSDILIPLLGVHDRLTPESFQGLPDQYIIKANHGCKWHKIVRDQSTLDIPSTIRYFDRIVESDYSHASGEFHYSLIKPKIVVETLLDDRGDSPADYNIFSFHSKSGFDYAITASLPRGERHVFFDKQWNVTEASATPEEIERLKRPKNFDRMLGIAEELSRGFDFLRIDLYNVDGQIYFGEITSTPASGLRAISCPARAAQRAAQWQLDMHNPMLYCRRAAG